VATAAVFSTLNAIRLTQAGTVIRFTDQGKTFDAREETVRFVERKLKAAGLYKEEETGKASAALMTAIKKFQVSQKLNSTGFPDIRTLLRLAAQK
jgi:peptidoglycan hydrolase-like protein with peptidoglycan-binding domain